MDKMKKMLKKKALRRIGGKRGFTLIELLIVMTIIAVLVAIVVMSLTGFIGAGESTAAIADQRSLQSAVVAFWVMNGAGDTDWPTLAGGSAGPGDIKWASEDDEGNVFVSDYVIEIPGSDADCVWAISSTGIVYVPTASEEACPACDHTTTDDPGWCGTP